METLKKLGLRTCQKLAGLTGARTARNIMSLAEIKEDGGIWCGGKRIGRYNASTGIGWCSLIGYIRLMRAASKAS